MKNVLVLFCLFSLMTAPVVAQEPVPPPDSHSDEFTLFDNGYIYSPQAMARLHGIVDSLNLRFKTCELNPRLPAVEQTLGHHVMGKNPSKALKKALEANLPFEEVLALSTEAVVTRDLLIVRHTYFEGYHDPTEERLYTEFFSPQIVKIGQRTYHERFSEPTSVDNLRRDMKGRWVFYYTDDYWEGFYFMRDFQQPILPEHYGRMIRYVDCLIDTSAVIFIGNDDDNFDPFALQGSTPAIEAFTDRARGNPSRPFPRDSVIWEGEPGYEEYRAHMDAWRAQNARWLRDTFRHTAEFTALLEAALREAEEHRGFTEGLESILVDADLGTLALDLKRRRRVWGMCSMDSRPREHAVEIAELAAETVQWDIFLRAHLDIMNDRFDRLIDASYGQGSRGTYIQEIEALGVNTLDLLLGSCLHADGLPQNHYQGNIGRIGRALAEYSNPEELEKRLAGMIADRRLDDFNRLWMYNLFAIYHSYLPEGDRKTTAAARLKQAGQTLPPYLAEKL